MLQVPENIARTLYIFVLSPRAYHIPVKCGYVGRLSHAWYKYTKALQTSQDYIFVLCNFLPPSFAILLILGCSFRLW